MDMGRPQKTTISSIDLCLLFLLIVLGQVSGFGQAQPLKLIISIEQQVLTAPLPARVTLHLHNSGKETLWLYHSVAAAGAVSNRSASGSPAASLAPSHPVEGPTLAVRLESADNHAAASGVVLESAGLPHPKLVRLAPDGDYEEKTVIRLAPAVAEGDSSKPPPWGRYKLAATYAAQYSNAAYLERILGVRLWQGEVQSNAIDVELQSPASAALGSIAGRVTGSDNVPLHGVSASLSDEHERLLDQTSSDSEGGYSFTHLPLGLYWVTVRRKDFDEDTTVFRHVVLTAEEPAGTINFLLTPPETFFPKQMLHKPVLFRVTDGTGQPLDNVALEITWSSGTVLDNVKGVTSRDGIAALELIPGRQYVTLKRKGCPKDEERVDVAPGAGIDGTSLVLECSKR